MAVVRMTLLSLWISPSCGSSGGQLSWRQGCLVWMIQSQAGGVRATVFGTPSSCVRFLGHGDLALATRWLTEARLQELTKQRYFMLKA